MAKKLFRKKAEELKKISIARQEEMLIAIIKKYEDEIIGMNQEQLLEGIDSKGISLGEYKNESYADFKSLLNPNRVVDLRLMGNFYKGMFLVGELPIIIWSYDAKTDKLVSRYGKNIFGVTEENKEIIRRSFLLEEYRNFVRSLLRL